LAASLRLFVLQSISAANNSNLLFIVLPHLHLEIPLAQEE
jgi:hypothetical protein